MFAFTAVSMLRWNVDAHLFANIFRPCQVLLTVNDYLVNRKEDLCIILLNSNVIICIEITITLATGTMLIGCLQHTCGMFNIAR